MGVSKNFQFLHLKLCPDELIRASFSSGYRTEKVFFPLSNRTPPVSNRTQWVQQGISRHGTEHIPCASSGLHGSISWHLPSMRRVNACLV